VSGCVWSIPGHGCQGGGLADVILETSRCRPVTTEDWVLAAKDSDSRIAKTRLWAWRHDGLNALG